MLNAVHLVKSFDGVIVLRNITMSVAKGETVAVIGRSGSGKSTLLRCLNHLEKVDKGTVTIDGMTMVQDGVSFRGQDADLAGQGRVFDAEGPGDGGAGHVRVQDGGLISSRPAGGCPLCMKTCC